MNNHSAFPTDGAHSSKGLSKLEIFTMAAMQGYMSSQTEMMAIGRRMNDQEFEYMAQYCVKSAKATLLELSKQQQG